MIPGIILGGPIGALGAVSGSIAGEDLGGMVGGVSNIHNLKDLGLELISNIALNVPDYLSSFVVSK